MSIKGSLFYYFITAIISIIIINTRNYYLAFLLIPIIFILYKKFGIQHILILIGVFSFFIFYRPNNEPKIDEYNIENAKYTIVETKEKYSIIKDDENKYIIYNNDNEFEENETILLTGTINKIEKDLELDVFEFKDFLNKKRVYYQIDYKEMTSLSKNTKQSTKIKNILTSKLEDESYNMTCMLLLNDKNSNIDVYNDLKDINAVHLFVVSGFHISFLFRLISFIFKKNKNIGNVIGLFVCFVYVFILDFSISATRALISLFLVTFLSEYLNRLDTIAIPGLLFLLIEPLNVFNYSYIMTFTMTISICFANNILKDQNKIIQIIGISFVAFISMLPIQLLLNYKINPISLISNIFLNYIVMFIFVLTIIGLPLSLIHGNIFGKIYELFNKFVSSIANVDSTIIFGNVKAWMVIIYYVAIILLFILLENKKYRLALSNVFVILLMVILLYNRQYLNPNTTVTFLNVYQGDCCIIINPHNMGVMLIDTGGLQNYDIANKKIMPYLNYHGIRKINIVSISHDDYDHCGALEALKNTIKIDKIIKDEYVDTINIGDISFTNLNKYYDDNSEENDKSVVLYGNIEGYNFMFTGDASINIEKKIIKDNKDIDVDILKIGHHGSKTSSCNEFIKTISPTYGIISVAQNNKYGHPNKEVINILNKNDVQIYRTDIDGSIRFILKDGKYKIETAN